MVTPSRNVKFGQQNLIKLVGALTEIRSKNDLTKITYKRLKDDLEKLLNLYIPDSTLRTTCLEMGIECKAKLGNTENLNKTNRYNTIKNAIIELADGLGHIGPAVTALKELK